MMRLLKINAGGDLDPEEVIFYGGKYSLWQRLKKGGIGSPKVIYGSGVKDFEQLKRNISGETGYINFELLKKGLILRFNICQRIRCAGILMHKIKAINLTGYRTNFKENNLIRWQPEAIYTGILEIEEVNNQDKLIFVVGVKDFDGIVKYFKKEEFENKFYVSFNSSPPEKEDEHLLKSFDFLS